MPITTRTAVVYITDDETEFDSELEALPHQALLDNKDGIQAFVDQIPNKEQFQNSVKRQLLDFVQFDAVRKYRAESGITNEGGKDTDEDNNAATEETML